MDFAEHIKNSLSMHQVLDLYSVGKGKQNNNMYICPFHNEKSPSLKAYKNSFFCFGCNVGGDLIKFVQLIENISFNEAMAKLDSVFALGLGIANGQTPGFKKIVENEKKRGKEQRKKDFEFNCWISLEREYRRLENTLRDKKPKSIDEVPCKEFTEALSKLEHLKYILDCVV